MWTLLLVTLISASAQDGGDPRGVEALTRRAERLQASEPVRARALLEEAAGRGYPPAQASLGILLFKEGSRANALRWLQTAAEAGEPRALLIYGTAMFNGDGVAPDRRRGYAMVREAAARGSSEAQATQSEMELVMPQADRDTGSKLATAGAGAAELADAPAAAGDARGGTKRSARPSQVAAEGRRGAGVTRETLARTSRSALPRPGAPLPSNDGPWRIQLGAFRQPGAGPALFARLAPRLPGKQPAFVPAGSLLRLQVGPYSSLASASAACRSLGNGQACIPVRAR